MQFMNNIFLTCVYESSVKHVIYVLLNGFPYLEMCGQCPLDPQQTSVSCWFTNDMHYYAVQLNDNRAATKKLHMYNMNTQQKPPDHLKLNYNIIV